MDHVTFLNQFVRRAIERMGSELKKHNDGSVNYLGEDISPEILTEIEALLQRGVRPEDPYREAQLRELAFWRWTAFMGYDGKDPRFFPIWQEYEMTSAYFRTGWPLDRFKDRKVVEIGSGPLGMVEYLPAENRVGFDPLNNYYQQLFSKCRNSSVRYIHEISELHELHSDFDLAISHNVIDHTDDPAFWFNLMFSKLRSGGNFIFQVNLSEPGVRQAPDHRSMHPSPLVYSQVMSWLTAKSKDFHHVLGRDITVNGERYFLAWGSKEHDVEVFYTKQYFG